MLLVMVVAMCGTICRAQAADSLGDEAADLTIVAQGGQEVLTANGSIAAVGTDKAADGASVEIILSTEQAEPLSVLVSPATLILNADAQALPLDRLVAGTQVRVRYQINAAGKNIANIIKIM